MLINLCNQYRKQLLLSGIFATFSFMHVMNIAVDHDTLKNQQDEQAYKAYIEEAIKLSVKQLNIADQILEDLAQKVNNNVFPNIEKEKARDAIRDTRSILQTLRTRSAVDLSPENLTLIIRVNELTTQQIQIMVSSRLIRTPKINPEALTVRSTLSPELVAQKLITLENQFKTIDKQAERSGLTWYNRLYRSLEQINEKYKVNRRVTELTILTILSIITIADLPDEKFDNSSPWLRQLKNLLGNVGIPATSKVFLDKNTYVEHDVMYNSHGISGKIATFFLLNKESFTIAIPALLQINTHTNLFSPFTKEVSDTKIKIQAKINQIKNKLRGGPSKHNKELAIKKPEITLDDVIGMAHIKKELEPILQYLQSPEKFDQAGIQPQKGILFYGPSRTGKSYFAEALSGSIKKVFNDSGRQDAFNFITLCASDLSDWRYNNYLEKYYGKRGIEGMLLYAQAHAPCVLFIDEIDLLGLQRERDRDTLAQFLTSMSGVLTRESEKQVIIIGATNRAEHLDFALKQPGRFGKLLYFNFPGFEDRLQFFKKELKKRCINPEDFDLNFLASQTEKCSYENLNAILKTSLQHARINHKIVTQEDLIEGLNNEVRHIMPAMKQIPEQEMKTIAAHLSGNALSTFLLNTPEKLIQITTRPISKKIGEGTVFFKEDYYSKEPSTGTPEHMAIEYGKCFTYNGTDTLNIKTRNQILSHIKMLLAGFTSEKILVGDTTYSYNSDHKYTALKYAKQLIYNGLNEEDIPKTIRTEKLIKAHELLTVCEREIEELLMQHKEELSTIYSLLLKQELVTAQEINNILKNFKKSAIQKPDPVKVNETKKSSKRKRK